MAKQPRVSIGMPVYNGENYLEGAIRSVLAQTFEDFELIISDNASDDSTREICERYIADPRVRYIRQSENLGAAPNFNVLFNLARGEFFKWAAHDDLLEPGYLAACVGALDRAPEAVLAFPRADVIDHEGNLVERYDVRLATDAASRTERFRALLLTWHRCYEIFGVFRKDVLAKTTLFEGYWGDDRTLLQQAALHGTFLEIAQHLFHPRTHAEQSITKMKGQEAARALWIDAKSAQRLVMPAWEVALGNLRAIQRGPLTSREKTTLYLAMIVWAQRFGRARLLRELLKAARHYAGKLLQPPQLATPVPALDKSASARPPFDSGETVRGETPHAEGATPSLIPSGTPDPAPRSRVA